MSFDIARPTVGDALTLAPRRAPEQTAANALDVSFATVRRSGGRQLPEAKGVLWRVAHLIVVEVGEDVASLGTPSLDALGPLAKRVVGVLRRVEALGPVKAEIDEVARHRDVRGPARRVADDQCDVPALEKRERVLAEP